MACTCAPGTEESGWHEVRCDDCLAEEREEWREMILRVNELRLRRYLKRRKRAWRPWSH